MHIYYYYYKKILSTTIVVLSASARRLRSIDSSKKISIQRIAYKNTNEFVKI